MLRKTAQTQKKTGFFLSVSWKQEVPFCGSVCKRGSGNIQDVHLNAVFQTKRMIVVVACKMPGVLLPDWKAQHIQQLQKVAQT